MLDGIEPQASLHLLVVDQVAELFFLVRPDLEQNDVAHDGVVDLGVVENLVGIIDRFGVNPFARLGVVFDLDRQIAAHGLHEHPILDGDVGMFAGPMLFPGGADPLEVVLGRETHLVIATVVDVLQLVVADYPLERLNVFDRLPDAEVHVEVRADDQKLGEHRVSVVSIDLLEIALETFVADQFERVGLESPVDESIHGEYVG